MNLQPSPTTDTFGFFVPVSGHGILRMFGTSGHELLPQQNVRLQPGETTYIDLRRMTLANLTASLDLPNTWDGKAEIRVSQLSESGSAESGSAESTRNVLCDVHGEFSLVGLRPTLTRLSLLRSQSRSQLLLPSEREISLKPGENHFDQVFGAPHELVVYAETEKTSFGHYATLEYEVQRNGRVIDQSGIVLVRGQRRLLAWNSDSVRLIYKTWLEGFSSMDSVVEERVIRPGESEIRFGSKQGSAIQITGLNWKEFQYLLVLQGQDLVKVVDLGRFPKNVENTKLTLSLPEGPLRLVFLQRELMWPGQSGIESNFSAPRLSAGELIPIHAEPRALALRSLLFTGNHSEFELCLLDQLERTHFKTSCTELKDSAFAVPKGLPLTLISRHTGPTPAPRTEKPPRRRSPDHRTPLGAPYPQN